MFPTGYGELIVTPPLALPPGRDLPPDLVLGLALCDVLRLLDLPTLAPFSVPAAFGALVSYRPDPHTGSPDTAAERKVRARCGAACGFSRACGSVGIRSRSFLEVRICCCGHARTASP